METLELGLSEADGLREALEDELGERELDGLSEDEGEELRLLLGLVEDEGLRLELGEREAEAELEAEELGLSDWLALGDRLEDGLIEVLGLSEALADELGEREPDGETEALGEAEALGDKDGLPKCRFVTDEPSVTGFQIQTKRTRPAVISAVPVVKIMSRLTNNSGKLATVLAIAVVWGVAAFHIS